LRLLADNDPTTRLPAGNRVSRLHCSTSQEVSFHILLVYLDTLLCSGDAAQSDYLSYAYFIYMLPQLPLKWHPLLYILYLSTMKYKFSPEFRLRLSSIQAYCEAFVHFVSVFRLTYLFGVYTACLLCARIFVFEFPGARA
jgi:hypothetical protein